MGGLIFASVGKFLPFLLRGSVNPLSLLKGKKKAKKHSPPPMEKHTHLASPVFPSKKEKEFWLKFKNGGESKYAQHSTGGKFVGERACWVELMRQICTETTTKCFSANCRRRRNEAKHAAHARIP